MSDWFEHFGYAEVADDLLVGAYPQDGDDIAVLSGEAVTRVFNLVSDIEYDEGARAAVTVGLEAAGIEEERLELVDYGGLLPGQIELGVRTISAWLDEGERVYLHCRAGWQRSAAIAAGVVAVRDEIELDEALDRIRDRKPTANPLPHQRDDLARWWSMRLARNS